MSDERAIPHELHVHEASQSFRFPNDQSSFMLNPLSEQSLAARASKPEPIADPVPFRGGDFCYVRCRLTGFDRDLPVCVKGSTEYAILELVTKDRKSVV